MTRPAVPGLTVCRSCAGEVSGRGAQGRADQLAGYRALEADGLVRLSTVDCLDQCGRGDAVVVRPPGTVRPSTDPVWLAGATTPEATTALRGWLAAGGPGAAQLPEALAAHAVPPPGEPGTEPAGR